MPPSRRAGGALTDDASTKVDTGGTLNNVTTAQDTLADELTAEQTAARLDEAARFYLGMTGEDFKERWAAGTLDDRIVLAQGQAAFARSLRALPAATPQLVGGATSASDPLQSRVPAGDGRRDVIAHTPPRSPELATSTPGDRGQRARPGHAVDRGVAAAGAIPARTRTAGGVSSTT